MKKLPFAASAAALVLASLLYAPAAQAANPSVQDQLDKIMSEHPGATQISPYSISWDGGSLILTLPGGQSTQAIGSCATGSFCAFSATSYGGTKLSFTSCSAAGSSNSLSLLTTVRSLANARTSGTVKATNSSTVMYTLPANTGLPSVTGTLTHLICYT